MRPEDSFRFYRSALGTVGGLGTAASVLLPELEALIKDPDIKAAGYLAHFERACDIAGGKQDRQGRVAKNGSGPLSPWLIAASQGKPGTDPPTLSSLASDSAIGETQFSVQMWAELLALYESLAKATALPDASIDAAGETLPKEFGAYLASGFSAGDQMVNDMSIGDREMFAKLCKILGDSGPVASLQFLGSIKATRPSKIDFLLFNAVGEHVKEYPPALDESARAKGVEAVRSLGGSANPVFRFIAVLAIQHVAKDKKLVISLLSPQWQ